MAKMKVWSNIDYMTISINAIEGSALNLPKGKGFEGGKELRPMGFYDRTKQLENGAILFTSGEWRQGCRLDMGGQCLQALRDDNWGDLSQLSWWLRYPQLRRMTRLDYALTIGGKASPESTLYHYDKGWVTTRIKTVRNDDRRRGNSGRTIKYGGLKADFILSVYDKGTERPDLRELYNVVTRVEMKMKAPHAQVIARQMLENGIDDVGCNVIKSKIDFPRLRWWQTALKSTKTPIPAGRVKTSSFWAFAGDVLGWVEARAKNGEMQEAQSWLIETLNMATRLEQFEFMKHQVKDRALKP